MGDYNFSRLNTRDFEHLIQSLCKKILGDGITVFGDGRDGGREATYVGEAPFPSSLSRWAGYWIVQAKFKQRTDTTDNIQWVITQFKNEMDKFKDIQLSGGTIPDNYLFFTNVVTTPFPKSGGIDRIKEVCMQYTSLIPNIHVFGYDDICRELDNNRDVAVSYASFIMPSDILATLYDSLKSKNQPQPNHTELLIRYMNKEFDDEMFSKIEQGGNLTDERVHLESVFVDLYATPDGTRPDDQRQKFLSSTIELGNTQLTSSAHVSKKNRGRRVLVSGAGYGKSTLTQFLCQTYRAFFLKNNQTIAVRPHIHRFVESFNRSNITQPQCLRFPFRIILKDYAGWIVKRQSEGKSVSVLAYMQHRIESKADGSISLDDIRDLMSKLAFLFVFDGLDEVPVTSNRAEVITQLESFVDTELSFAECDALIIATTRPQGYSKEFDEDKYEHLQIANFDEDGCKEYLDKLLVALEPSDDQRGRYFEILNQAMSDEVVIRLMQTPLQATIMTILVKSGGEPPRAKFNLFTEFYETMFRRERQKDVAEVIKRNKEYIDAIHYKLGYTLQKQSEGASNPSSTIDSGEFQKFVIDYLRTTVGLPSEDADNYSKQIIDAVKTRLVFISETEDGQIGFSVRSTQEFFAAQYLVHNRSDKDISSILSSIAHSAYWRNTFLFAVGYLNQFKDYWVVAVEALCSELNGATLDYGVDSPSRLLKEGSWLALDILNEDIFRAKPKMENKFIAFIEPLFQVVPQDGHMYFSKLPKHIIDRTIKPLVEKYLQSDNFLERRSALTVAMHLIRTSEDSFAGLVDRLWDDMTYFFYHGYELDIEYTDWYVKKLALHSAEVHPLEFSLQLSNQRVITRLRDLDLMNDSVQRVCIVNCFLQAIEDPEADGQMLAMLLDIEPSRSLLDKSEISVELVNGYRRYDISVFNNPNHLLGAVRSEAVRLDIAWVVTLLDFLVRPSKETLSLFLTALRDEDSVTYAAVRTSVTSLNWVLSRFFAEHPEYADLELGLQRLESGELGDVEQWREMELQISTSIETLKSLSWRSISSSSELSTFEDFYQAVYVPLKVKSTSEEDEQALADEILLAFRTLYQEPVTSPEIVEELMRCIKISSLEWSRMECWYYLVDSCSMSQLDVLFKDTSLPKINLLDYGMRYYPLPASRLSPPVFFQKFIDKVSWIITSQQVETHLIKLLPIACMFVRNLDGKINYSSLVELQCNDPENEVSRIMLCMFDKELDSPKYEKLLTRLEWVASTSPTAFKLFPYLYDSRMNSEFIADYCIRIFNISAAIPEIQQDEGMNLTISKVRSLSTRQPAKFPDVIQHDWE